MKTMSVGIVGCGKISSIYLQSPQVFPQLRIAACCDLNEETARAKAEEFGIPRVMSLGEMLRDSSIDVILNLTLPATHAEISIAALKAGKSVYNEKPLALSRQEGKEVLELAKEKGLRVGCAPDTFLGAGLQTCRKLIDDGAIGKPVAATAFMMCHGHESWHPNPAFYYQPGAGPLFDMGPYYLTALIHLLGPVKRVCSSTGISFPQRIITSAPRRGETIEVKTPTHVTGVVDFSSGAIGTLVMSFDVWAHKLPRMEIYGTEGTLIVPDPNTFGGPVLLRRSDEKEWREMSLTHEYRENSRGLGLAEMVSAIEEGRDHRASGTMAYHVLDTMQALLESSEQGRHLEIASSCQRPMPLPSVAK